MHVPAVLPVRDLVSEIEAIPQPRQIDARGQRDVAEPPALVPRAVFARVLKVDRERIRGGEHEAAGQRRRLIPELADRRSRRRPCRSCPGWKNAWNRPLERIVALAAAVLQEAARTQRPAAHRRHLDLQAREPRLAAGRAPLEGDVIDVAHLGDERLVAKTELRDRRVVRERDAGHRSRLRADEHAAVAHGRPPVVAEADVQLRVLEAEAQHRAGRIRDIRIGNTAELHQCVVGRLVVRRRPTRPTCLPPTCPG